MTQHELSQLVREHAVADEPVFPGPEEVLVRGRQRVRGRRLVAGGVTTLAAVVALGGVLTLGSGDGPDGDDTTIDPATQQALEDYDAWAMPDLLDREARAVLSRSVSDLGPSEFEATDANATTIPSQYYDKASGMSVTFGDADHEFQVDLSHARSEAEGSAQRYCDEGLADGTYLECTVERVDGATVISKLWALRPFHALGGARLDGSMIVTRADQLNAFDPDKLWFEHSVKVVKSETFVTYTSERVKAPTQEAAQGLFTVPVADLVELAVDPMLVIPHPPAGQNGCPAWMLDGENVSCGVTPPDVDFE
jgi:hypothetical protein